MFISFTFYSHYYVNFYIIDGKVTPGVGAASSKLCVSPATNFMFGIFGLFVGLYLISRIFISQYHVTTFLRKARVVRQLLNDCDKIMKDVNRLKNGSSSTTLRNNKEFTLDGTSNETEIEFKAPPSLADDILFRFTENQIITIAGITGIFIIFITIHNHYNNI